MGGDRRWGAVLCADWVPGGDRDPCFAGWWAASMSPEAVVSDFTAATFSPRTLAWLTRADWTTGFANHTTDVFPL